MNEVTIYKSGLQLRREAEANSEMLAKFEPVERAVFLASTKKTIREYGEQELGAALIDSLKWIAKDIGYKSATQEDAQYLLARTMQILRLYYADMTLQDFRMAFELACTGELDEYLPRDRFGQPDKSHYQNFNAEYIGKIMKAYKARRRAILSKVKYPKQELRDRGEERRIAALAKADLRACYLEYKYRGRMPYCSSICKLIFLNLLASVGLADRYEIAGEEQRALIAGKIGSVAGSRVHGYSDTARAFALKRAFDEMIEDEIQIGDYI